MTATQTDGPRWAVHAWDGSEWHTYHPEPNTQEAAEAVRDRVKGEHPGWGVKLVDERL